MTISEPVKPEDQRNEASVTKDNFRLSCLSQYHGGDNFTNILIDFL